MATDDLKELYELFDQLIDLSEPERRVKLEELRAAGRPIVAQLESLLGFQDQSEHSTDQLLGKLSDKLPMQQWLAASTQPKASARHPSDLRELVGLFRWDQTTKQFYAGDYRIGKCLAFNSYTATYFAEDSVLGRRAVITFAFPNYLKDKCNREQFLDSAKIVSEISHPYVATILGVVQQGPLLGIARQWIPGSALAYWLPLQAPLSVSTVAIILQRVAEGVSTLHLGSALHGDLKPTNIIMRDNQPLPIITDFGTVFRIEDDHSGTTGWRGGTPGYIAPEVMEQKNLDERFDLYSLGVILRELLEALDSSDSSDERKELETLRDDLLAKKPEDRPPHCQAIIERLMKLTGVPTAAWTNAQPARSHSNFLAQTKIWTRRSFVGLSATLVPFVIGRRWRQLQQEAQKVERHFIPGTKEDIQTFISLRKQDDLFIWRDKNSKLTHELETQRIFSFANSHSSLIYLKKGILSGSLISEPIPLPTRPIRWNSIFLRTIFNAPSRHATLRLDSRSISGNPMQSVTPWKLCAIRQNYFGGAALRNLIGTIERAQMKPDSSLQFRISFDLSHSWDGDDWPPLSLVVDNLHGDDVAAVEFNLWYEGNT